MKITKYSEFIAALAAVVGVMYAMYNGEQNLKNSRKQFISQLNKQDSLFLAQSQSDSIDFEAELMAQEKQYLRRIYLDSVQFESQISRYDRELSLLSEQFSLTKLANDTTLKLAILKLASDQKQLEINQKIANKGFDFEIIERGILRDLGQTSMRIASILQLKEKYLREISDLKASYFESKTNVKDFRIIIINTVDTYSSSFEKYIFSDRIFNEADQFILLEIFDDPGSYEKLRRIYLKMSSLHINPLNPWNEIEQDIRSFQFSEKLLLNNMKRIPQKEKDELTSMLENVTDYFKKLSELKNMIDQFLEGKLIETPQLTDTSAS